MRTAATASPGWKGVFADAVAVVDDVDDEPLGTATKPMASSHGAKRVIVSGAKLDSDSGTAIGFAPLIVLAGLAPARPLCIFAKSSSLFPFDIALRKSPALMRAAVSSAVCPPPLSAIFSICSIGVIPATGSLANCHE